MPPPATCGDVFQFFSGFKIPYFFRAQPRVALYSLSPTWLPTYIHPKTSPAFPRLALVWSTVLHVTAAVAAHELCFLLGPGWGFSRLSCLRSRTRSRCNFPQSWCSSSAFSSPSSPVSKLGSSKTLSTLAVYQPLPRKYMICIHSQFVDAPRCCSHNNCYLFHVVFFYT